MSTAQPEPRPRVLVALDGSPAAATAFPLARVVAAQLGAAVEILHCAAAPLPDSELRERLHLDSAELEGIAPRLYLGEPAPGILHAAADPGVALVVLTTHGRSVEPGRPLGRIAEAVIADTTRPVLLVRPEAAAEQSARELRRLLLPLDGTPTTATALRPATDLAGRIGASVDLLYVASPAQAPPAEPGSIGAPRYVDQPQHEWPHWASEVIERLCVHCAECPPDVPIRMFLAHGEIGAEIARFAAEHEDDAIIMVRRSRLERGRAGILRAVLDRMPCPVLLLGGSP